MDLGLSETQTIFRDTVREFLEAKLPFSRVRELESRGEADAELWAALHGQGWLGIAVPAESGGEGGLLEASLLVEEVQRRAALVPVAETIACAATLHRHGPSGRSSERVHELLTGGATAVPAVLERNDRFGGISAEVTSDGRLSGEKFFVDYASFASHHLVAARRGGSVELFWVDRADPGVAIQQTRSLGRTPQARVRYDGVAAESVCGEEGLAFLTRLARTLCAVQAVACMQQALDMSVAYTAVREQFGRPIATFQAVQHHAADMAMALESTRFLVYEAVDALERDTATDPQVAIAKAAASQAAPELVMLAHQLHGGQGFIEENDLYFFSIRGKERSLAWGTAEECLECLELIAEGVDRPEDWL
jgi:alkylation response protein AidB-like acyl-CoA dehydrogenase